MENQQRGFTLLEGIIGLSVVMSVLVLGYHHLQQRVESDLHQNTAEHLRVVTTAAKQYVQKNYYALPDSQGEDLYKKLLEEKLIPNVYEKKNLYGQTYAIYVHRENNSRIQLIVLTTKGQVIDQASLRRISRRVGGEGGYITQQRDTSLHIIGAQQTWKLSADSLPKSVKESDHIKPGHLASLHYLHAEDITHTSNILHRTFNSEHPALNQMETNLTMKDNEIKFSQDHNLGTINAQSMTLSQGSQNVILECEEENPTITVTDGKDTLTITHEKVSFTVDLEAQKEKTQWLDLIKGFSSSELHGLWNKIPYFTLKEPIKNSDPTLFANQVCATPTKTPTIGRLFMVGDDGVVTYLYICSQSTSNTEPSAHLIQALDPKNKKNK